MSKQLAITTVAVLALLAIWVWATAPAPTKTPGASWEMPLVTDLDRIELSRFDGELVLETDGDGTWQLREPLAFSANDGQMESVVSLFTDADNPLLISNEKEASSANLNNYGFNEGDGDTDPTFEVGLFDGGQGVARFEVGHVVEAQSGARGTWVRPEGTDTIYRINRDLRAVLDKELGAWRSRDVLVLTDEEKDALSAIDIAYGPHQIRLESAPGDEDDEDTVWTMVQPAGQDFDSRLIRNFVRTLNAVRADDFADDLTAETAGLQTPTHTVTIYLGEGEEIALRLGDEFTAEPETEEAAGDVRRYVRRDDGPIFALDERTANNLMDRLGDFLSRNLFEVERDTVASVTIAMGDGESIALQRNAPDPDDPEADLTWQMRSPQRADELETNAVRRLLNNLADVQATRFADEEVTPAAAGLLNPVRMITYTLDDESEHQLEIGDPVAPLEDDEEPDNVDRFARLDGGAIVELRSHKVRPLMQSAEDLIGQGSDG